MLHIQYFSFGKIVNLYVSVRKMVLIFSAWYNKLGKLIFCEVQKLITVFGNTIT